MAEASPPRNVETGFIEVKDVKAIGEHPATDAARLVVDRRPYDLPGAEATPGMPSLVRTLSESVVLTSVDRLLSWSRARSIWPLGFGLACCAIEMMATLATRFDIARHGYEAMRNTPRQSDVMIVAGTVTYKMGLRIKRLYEQMPEPRYVISMGSCANCGGPYWKHGYHVVKGVDKIIPVDVYVPGCPPRPETLIEGFLLLKKKIEQERVLGYKIGSLWTPEAAAGRPGPEAMRAREQAWSSDPDRSGPKYPNSDALAMRANKED
jgi:NADH-quinone oxidoreductase subunit B